MQHGPVFLATSKCTISKWAQCQFSGLLQSISALPCSWHVVKFDSWVCMGLSVWLTRCHDAENLSRSMGMSPNQASLIKSLRNIFGYPHLNKKPSPLGPLSIFFMASCPFGQVNRFPFESLWHVSGCPKSGKNWTPNRQGTAEASRGQGNQHSRDLAVICRWLSTQNSLEIDAASPQNCVNKYTSPLGRSSMEDSSHKIEVKTTSTNWGSDRVKKSYWHQLLRDYVAPQTSRRHQELHG